MNLRGLFVLFFVFLILGYSFLWLKSRLHESDPDGEGLRIKIFFDGGWITEQQLAWYTTNGTKIVGFSIYYEVSVLDPENILVDELTKITADLKMQVHTESVILFNKTVVANSSSMKMRISLNLSSLEEKLRETYNISTFFVEIEWQAIFTLSSFSEYYIPIQKKAKHEILKEVIISSSDMTASESEYGKGYRAGYKEGYEEGYNDAKENKDPKYTTLEQYAGYGTYVEGYAVGYQNGYVIGYNDYMNGIELSVFGQGRGDLRLIYLFCLIFFFLIFIFYRKSISHVLGR
ncbi:MAG: hypothetical protein Q6363_007825 [Candidatus Njordarchaeota archaeon]